MARDVIILFTDGACHPNPGVGGWGVHMLLNGEVHGEICGGYIDTTNNRMEMNAIVQALTSVLCRITEFQLEDPARQFTVIVFTDSKYVKNGMVDHDVNGVRQPAWIKAWKANGWRTANRRPVRNRDFWKFIDRLCGAFEKDDTLQLYWKWVAGHAGIEGNERADELAREGRRRALERGE